MRIRFVSLSAFVLAATMSLLFVINTVEAGGINECKDVDCLIKSAGTCSPARFADQQTIEEPTLGMMVTADMQVEIKGLDGSGKCRYSLRFKTVPPKKIQNDESGTEFFGGNMQAPKVDSETMCKADGDKLVELLSNEGPLGIGDPSKCVALVIDYSKDHENPRKELTYSAGGGVYTLGFIWGDYERFFFDNLEVLKDLYDRGMELDERDTNGNTALISAVRASNIEAVSFLLNNGADVNRRAIDGDDSEPEGEYGSEKYGWAPILEAIKKGNIEIVKLLLDKKANVNAQYRKGAAPLNMAAEGGHIEIAKLLIGKGASVNTRDLNGNTPLIAGIGGGIEMVKFLLGSGADVNERTEDSWTVLMHAVQSGNEDIVRYLLTKGVDANVKAKDGLTALTLAKEGNNPEIIKLLKSPKGQKK